MARPPALVLPGVPSHTAAEHRPARHLLHSPCLIEQFVEAASVDNERVLLVAATFEEVREEGR